MKILLAVDGSPYTKRMLAYLAAHDEFLGASHQMNFITVVQPVTPNVTHFIDDSIVTTYYDEQAQAVFKPVMAFAAQQKWRSSCKQLVGHAADAIAEEAKASRYDLLVMGSHGHGALVSLALGSVASGVIGRCQTPLLLIR